MERQEIKTDSIDRTQRIETGPLKINDDWTGYFIRGDHAGWMAMQAETVKERIDKLSEEEKEKLPFYLFTLLEEIKHFGSSREM